MVVLCFRVPDWADSANGDCRDFELNIFINKLSDGVLKFAERMEARRNINGSIY